MHVVLSLVTKPLLQKIIVIMVSVLLFVGLPADAIAAQAISSQAVSSQAISSQAIAHTLAHEYSYSDGRESLAISMRTNEARVSTVIDSIQPIENPIEQPMEHSSKFVFEPAKVFGTLVLLGLLCFLSVVKTSHALRRP